MSHIDGTEVTIPQLISNNLWITLNNLDSNEITSPVNIEFEMLRTDYGFSLPFTLTDYDDLFDLQGIDYTVDMGAGNDVATVYEDHGIINGGTGERLLQDAKVVIAFNTTIVFEAIASNRNLIIPNFNNESIKFDLSFII